MPGCKKRKRHWEKVFPDGVEFRVQHEGGTRSVLRVPSFLLAAVLVLTPIANGGGGASFEERATVGDSAVVGSVAPVEYAGLKDKVGVPEVSDEAERLWLPPDAPENDVAYMRKAASYMLGDAKDIDLDDPVSVFSHVISQLDDKVDVIPTENYLYWRFHTEDKYVWGNLRLGPGSRDENKIHIGYYEFREDLTGPEEANARYSLLSEKDGIGNVRISDFVYDVSFEGKTVRFALNEVNQDEPASFEMPPNEVFVFRTEDESGIQFHLLFDKNTKNFLFVANEDEKELEAVEMVGENLALDMATGFLFYVDHRYNDRLVLVGVYRRNVAQNNYYDGPADQLSDNYIPDVPEYRDYLNQAYPFTKNVIDEYGFYIHDPGNRIAVAPYYTYNTVEEVAEMLDVCQEYGGTGEVMACMMPGGFHAANDGAENAAFTPQGAIPGLPALEGLDGIMGNAAEDLQFRDAARVMVTVMDETWEGPDPLGADGWTATGLWHLVTDPPTQCPPGPVYVSPVTSAYYGMDATCDYNDGTPNFGTLTSPVITNLPSYSVLEFWHRRQTEGNCGIHDISEVQISTNGLDWDILWEVCEERNLWVHSGQIFLSDYAGKDVQIRFFFDTITHKDNGHQGWMIDDISIYYEDDGSGDGVVPIRPRHMAGLTWHMVGVSRVPGGPPPGGGPGGGPPGGVPVGGPGGGGPGAGAGGRGPIHAAGITWHLNGLTFIPAGTIHNTGSTWHYGGVTFIPAGSKHNTGHTWHYTGATFIPRGTKHNSGVTWHVPGATFIPAGSKHAAGITWHLEGITFIPRGSKHNSGVTWHVAGETFIPAGSKHAAGITWHLPGVSFIPRGTKHNSGVTWHVAGQTLIPPGSKHAAGITWHLPGISFIPRGTKHNSGVTWHVSGETFIPRGSKHAAGITWHLPGVSFIPRGTRHNTGSTWHLSGFTLIPPGSRHNSGYTWHYSGQTVIPPGTVHNSGYTWHYPGQSFIPEGTKHNSGYTWHCPGGTFIPAGTKHNSGVTWHVGGQTFIPPGTIHNSGHTWHYDGQSFIPAGSKHNSGYTWHYPGASFIPSDAKHNSGVTWHVGGVTFIPGTAKHMAGTTWHEAGGTFLALAVAGGVFDLCEVEADCVDIPCHVAECSPEDQTCDWIPTPGVECDDGNPYTAMDICNEYGECVGEVVPGTVCDDGNPCTIDDLYDTDGVCVGIPAVGLACDDGNNCTLDGSSVCDSTGECSGGTVNIGDTCDDGDECNFGDLCGVDGGCYAQVDQACDNMAPCDGEESCDPLYGCMHGEPPACDDFCSGEDGACDDSLGGCVTMDDSPMCDAPDDCMEADCNEELNGCEEIPIDCDDGDPCTEDLCDMGECIHNPLPEGETCDDGSVCTTGDACMDGVCTGIPIDCGDCAACDPETGGCDIAACFCEILGDVDGNKVIDLDDYDDFAACMSGPMVDVAGDACLCFDFDGDMTIDMKDFAEFQRLVMP